MMRGKMTKESKRLQKDFIWNTLGSGLYAFTSLFFLVMVTRLNGLDDAGVFTFAFSNACVFQVIGTYAGRAYQVTEKRKELDDNAYVHNRIISIIAMVVFGLLFGIIRGYDLYKFGVVFLLILYKAIDGFSEVLFGIVQKNDRLYQVGISYLMRSVIGPLVFLVVDLITNDVLLAAASLSVVSLAIMLLYDFRITKKCKFKLQKVNFKNTLTIFKVGFYTFLVLILTQYLINAPKYAIDTELTADNQTIYGIIVMPAMVIVLAGNLLIYPFLTKIKRLLKERKIKAMNKLVGIMSLLVLGIGLLAAGLGYVLAVPLFQLLYGLDTSAHLGELLMIIFGATLYSVTVVLSNTLIAMRKTASQAVIFVITSIVAFFAANALVKSLGIFGGAMSYIISMGLLLLMYILDYMYCVRKEKGNA